MGLIVIVVLYAIKCSLAYRPSTGGWR